MRIFFIPGLGEENFIFDKIHPHIAGEKIFIENWDILAKVPEDNLTVLTYAEFLTEEFKIDRKDVVIGHSMGGLVAVFIKHLTGCKVIQVSTWTDGKKVITIPLPRNIMYWLVKRGLAFFQIGRKVLVWLNYQNKPSKEIFIKIFERLRTGDRVIAAKQLMVIFNVVKEKITAEPDLRIHAKGDKIVAPPDEHFYEVPGDHFSLYTFPEDVYRPIVKFLQETEKD